MAVHKRACFDNSPTFLNAPTVAILPKSVGIVPNLLIILSSVLKVVVPKSTTNLIRSLSSIV